MLARTRTPLPYTCGGFYSALLDSSDFGRCRDVRPPTAVPGSATLASAMAPLPYTSPRSEERRAGRECWSRWWTARKQTDVHESAALACTTALLPHTSHDYHTDLPDCSG